MNNMKIKNSIGCLVVSLFSILPFSLLSYSQTGSPKFIHLTTSNGLSQSHVSAILKDKSGFMWFATDAGINKYDGYRFTIYKHNPEKASSISSDFVYDLLEDKTGNLWVATASGLDKFDRKVDSFVHYHPKELNNINVKDIFQDSKNRIWLGTTGGLYLFDAAKGSFVEYRHKLKGNSISNDVIYRITEGNDGRLWIATKDGLNALSPETGQFVCYRNEAQNINSIGANWIKSVYKDSKGNIWAGTQGSGIAMFNPKENNFTNYRHSDANPGSIGYNDILSFAEDNKGNLWVGTENGGISVFDYATNSFKQYLFDIYDNNSLSNNSIYCIYRDDIDNMWIGTWSGGVNFLPFHGDKFRLFKEIPGNKNSLSSSVILTIAGASDGTMWIGTDGGGLNHFDELQETFIKYRHDNNNKNSISSDYVLSVVEVEPGTLLIGYHRGGFDLFNIKTGIFTHHVPDPKNSNSLSILTVNVVYEDRLGLLWLGTWGGGLDVYDRKANSFVHYKNNPADGSSIDDNFINVIHEDNSGNIWVGTDRGLNLFNRKTNQFIHYTHNPLDKKSISLDMVESMLNDKEGNLWIATGGGLNLFDPKTNSFKVYTEKDGLPSNSLHDIMEDKDGNLWITSNQGLSKFNPRSKTCRNYGTADGLQGNEFKSRCAYKTRDGQLFFGGPDGLNVFYPDSIRDNNFVPPVYITEFQIFNKLVAIGNPGSNFLKQEISETNEINLSYKQSVFTFEFSALNFTLPEKNLYAYKLVGFDKEWNYVGTKRTATYTNLNPGTYTFKVKGSNNDGIWNEKGTSVLIKISPPFWLTWWFMLAVFMLIAGGVFSFYRFRINIIKKQKILLEQKVNQQTIQLVHLNEEERNARLEAEQSRAESEIARNESEKARQHAYHVNEELQIKNKQLEQFAYVASHDLQEPLRTTAGFVNLLQEKYQGKIDEKADKYLTFISNATARMKVVIQDLLDYSRIGAKVELKRIDCNIMLKDMLADIMAAVQEAKADIQYTELPVINGHPTEIKLLFQNLVINAIKFRRKDVNPLIKISAQKKGDYWEFSVNDNGIGIEKEQHERIFEIFQRLHARTEYEGSGIGLSHCKKIVELHKGKIWVESEPGEGTTFYFTLPALTPGADQVDPDTKKTKLKIAG